MTESIRDMLAASRFARDCLLGPGYRFPDALADMVALTPTGLGWRDRILQRSPDAAPGDVHAALLGHFARGNDVFIDLAASASRELIELLSQEIRQRRINFPYVFGRLLADRFIADYGAEPIQQMTAEQTQALLAVTPQGIFQLDHWVTGPFGLLPSASHRHLRPHNCGPAIRCRKIGCNTLHHIQMRTSETAVGEIYHYVDRSSPERNQDVSQRLIDVEIPDEGYYLLHHPGGLPALLGNGFTDDELASVLVRALRENLGGLRQRVDELLAATADRSPESLVDGFDAAERLHLLLTLSDEHLVLALESTIDSGVIELSPTEVRRSFENRHINSGYLQVDAEASHLGVRFIPRNSAGPVPILALLKSVYAGENMRDLAWQLRRNVEGTDPLSKLESLLYTEDPKETLHRMLFSTQDALQRAFENLRFGRFALPGSTAEEQLLLERILWKLGSPAPVPPVAHGAALLRINDLSRVCATRHADAEEHVNAVRGAAVNMFVALEELLTLTVDFCCWALLHDHYSAHPFDRFRYSPKRAASFSRPLLERAAAEHEGGPRFSSDRRNTLAPLVSALRLIAEICERHLAEPDGYRRPQWQVPTYARYSKVDGFPLYHTVPFLDLRASSQRRLLDSLRAAALALTRTNIPSIRNQVTHSSDALPTDIDLLRAADAIRDTIITLHVDGLVATVYRYAGERIDAFNRRRVSMADGNGDDVTLYLPHQLGLLGLPQLSEPQVIMNGAFFTGTIEPLRFAVASDSQWTETWHDAGLIHSWLMNEQEPDPGVEQA